MLCFLCFPYRQKCIYKVLITWKCLLHKTLSSLCVIMRTGSWSLYALNTYSPTFPFFPLYYNTFDCETTLRDKKVNIQAPCGGTRDPYFMRFQHSPPPHFWAGNTFCITALFLHPPPSLFCCCVTVWGEICMFHMSNGRAAGPFRRYMARFSSIFWGGESSKAQHGAQACATPFS